MNKNKMLSGGRENLKGVEGEGEGSGGEGEKWVERGREEGMWYLPVHPSIVIGCAVFWSRIPDIGSGFYSFPITKVVGKSPSRTVPDRTYDCTRSWYPENNGFWYRLLSQN